MLIKSIVRTTLGIKNHVVKKVYQAACGIVILLDRHRRRRLVCSRCGTLCRVRDRLAERSWRHVKLWGIEVTIRYRPCRVACERCGRVVVEAIPWSQGKSRLSTGLIYLLAAWARLLAWDVVARLMGVHWNTVASAVRQAVAYGLEHRDPGKILYIGIDELSRRKGHKYVTNVYDLEGKRLLWSGAGRGKATLEAFFAEHGETLMGQVVAVCCDMWRPYIDVLKDRLPGAALVLDKFHLVRQLLAAVDQVRRDEARELKAENPELLARSRYLWLKNPERMRDKERARLGYLQKLNLRTARAWLLKESFKELWTYKSKYWARRYLKKWCWWATHSRLQPLRDFAWTLMWHAENILNWFDHPISNAVVEGLNNKAKVVSRRSYGFRTEENFITALYHCLGRLPEPQLLHRFV
jgi:transposase